MSIYTENQEKDTWWGWVILILIIGLMIWAANRPEFPAKSPAQIQKEEDEDIRQAKEKCFGVREDLFKACVESELERQVGHTN